MRDDPVRSEPVRSEPVPAVVLVREHLLAQLAEPAAGPLALLVAPAGYGKTTLLTQYADRFPGRVVRWRPCRGTTEAGSLLAAINRQLPGATASLTIEECVLAVERHPGPVLLLVDDLQLVRGTAAEAAVEEIALLAPANLQVVAASQRMPLLNLTRRELAATTVLGPGELRLSTEEIRELVAGAGAWLSPYQLSELEDFTLGWPAALHLLRPTLWQARTAAPPKPVTHFGPGTRTYLDREVLGGLPDQLLRFLRQVGVLPVLDADACDTLTGGQDSAWLLDELAHDWALLAHNPAAGTFHWVPLLRHHLLARADERAEAALLPDEPVRTDTRPPATRHTEQAVVVRCFGGFELALGTRSLDWSRVRPRARALLRILAIQAGQPVHRELLMEELWPHRPPATAARSLQVAVSALRTFLEPGVGRGGAQLLLRSGEAYLLRMPAQADCDLLRFEAALAEGQRARAAGRIGTAGRALRTALDSYTGDLLPEDGPAEWVVHRRDHYRRLAAEAALTLAKIELARDRPLAAAKAARRGVEIDPFRDDAWQTLITAQQRCGDAAAAALARRGHVRMLHSLGLAAELPGDGGHESVTVA